MSEYHSRPTNGLRWSIQPGCIFGDDLSGPPYLTSSTPNPSAPERVHRLTARTEDELHREVGQCPNVLSTRCIHDGHELVLQDWLGTAGFDRPEDYWLRQWANAYMDLAAVEKRAWFTPE